jgi:hypothetical protein
MTNDTDLPSKGRANCAQRKREPGGFKVSLPFLTKGCVLQQKAQKQVSEL